MIIQDDGFLSLQEQISYKEQLLGLSLWAFNEGTNQERPTKESLRTDNSFQFVSPIWEEHPMFNLTREIFFRFVTKHQIPYRQVTRIKSNISTRRESYEYGAPHVDQDYDHKVFLYYVNDSDGDTVFFKQHWHQGIEINEQDLVEELRVAPKMGLGVVFNGLQYHAATPPVINDYRCVINIDFN